MENASDAKGERTKSSAGAGDVEEGQETTAGLADEVEAAIASISEEEEDTTAAIMQRSSTITVPGAVAVAGTNTAADDAARNVENIATSATDIQQQAARDGTDASESEDEVDEEEVIDRRDTTIRAELVNPPVEAYVVVSIDEPGGVQESSSPLAANGGIPFTLSSTPLTAQDQTRLTPQDERPNKSSRCCGFSRPQRLLIIIVIVIAIAVSLSVPLAMRRGDDNSKDNTASTNTESQESSPPSMAPSFPYKCYTSAIEIFQDQMDEEQETPDAYIVCPDTTIQMGVPENGADNTLFFEDGDIPLMPTRTNVVIQCGIDGRRENNCIIKGGNIQVLAQPYLEGFKGIDPYNSTIDGFTVRGMTFTGTLVGLGKFSPVGVIISNSGSNIRFEDCLWTNMTVTRGLMYIGNSTGVSSDQVVEGDAQVTVSNCSFQHIVYEYPLFFVRSSNSLHLEGCQFRNIQLMLVQSVCNQSSTGQCSGLLYCFDSAHCSLTDVCLESPFDYTEPSMILRTTASNFTISGNTFSLSSGDDDDDDPEEESSQPSDNGICDVATITPTFDGITCDRVFTRSNQTCSDTQLIEG